MQRPTRDLSFFGCPMWLALALTCGLAGCSDDAKPAQPQAGAGAGDAAAGSGGAVGSGTADSGPPVCTSCGGCAEEKPVLSANHVAGPIEYLDPPPVGGDHDQCWATWGVHTDAVPARNWVHNLEHGGVVFLYDCADDCTSDLAAFSELARANERTLLTPYPELRTRFALVAWGHRILSDCVDSAAFQEFYDQYFDHGRESISSDPPAGCP